jgi:hypothetical protein
MSRAGSLIIKGMGSFECVRDQIHRPMKKIVRYINKIHQYSVTRGLI